MKTLVLDTSSSILYVSFSEDGKVFYSKTIEGKNNHSENLIPAIVEGLKIHNLTLKSFGKILVGIGPGSYTGLRVSVTVAKMLSWTLNIPLYSVSSLELLGSGYFCEEGIFAITSRAKHNSVYGKLVEIKDRKRRELIGDCLMEKETFIEKIKDYDYTLIDESNYRFDPESVFSIKVDDLHTLTPNYLQKEEYL